MAFTPLAVKGKVIKNGIRPISGNSTGLQVTLSVASPERKKEGDKYSPTFLMQFAIWGREAEYHQDKLQEGDVVIVAGSLVCPNVWTKDDGTTSVTLKMDKVTTIERLGESEAQEGSYAASQSSKAKGKATGAKKSSKEVDFGDASEELPGKTFNPDSFKFDEEEISFD